MSDRAPWKRPNPKAGKDSHPLTGTQKTAARKRAKKAGRRYPNLVDNMWAASKGRTRAKAKSD